MKCPKCSFDQKYKDGMVCRSCSYRFALNPKEMPKITDYGFNKIIERLSGGGEYVFTKNQLLALLYRMSKKKNSFGMAAGCITGVFFGFFVFIGLGAILQLNPLGAGIIAAGVFAGIMFFAYRSKNRFSVDYTTLHKTIEDYNSLHPISKMVDGKTFENRPENGLEAELSDFAPEKILIVERNEVADMLILNRYHLENKTLVVSAQKYPKTAYNAAMEFLRLHPDIPVYVLHDASEKGAKLKNKLVKDASWNLSGKQVTDMGIHIEDVNKLDLPMWVPPLAGGKKSKMKITSKGKSDELAQEGFRMPFDAAPPIALMGGIGMAMVLGSAMLSDAYMDEQKLQDDKGSGGFG